MTSASSESSSRAPEHREDDSDGEIFPWSFVDRFLSDLDPMDEGEGKK